MSRRQGVADCEAAASHFSLGQNEVCLVGCLRSRTNADMHTSLTTDLWQHIASFFLDTHKLRTVCNVAQDLCSIQSTCKSSRACAADYWPSVVLLCQIPNRRIVREINFLPQLKYHLACQDIFVDHAVLARAVKLPSDLLIIYLQVQTDKSITVTPWRAESTFQLTATDLQNQLQPVNKVQMRQEQIKTKAGQSCSKTVAWVPIYSKQACAALQVYCELAVIRYTVVAVQAVIALAIRIWGSLAGLKYQAAVSKEARRKRKGAEEATAKQAQEARLSRVSATCARKEELSTLLSAHGLQLCSDSRLCSAYINNGVGDPKQITQTMLEMDWLFKNTDYSEQMRKVSHSTPEKSCYLLLFDLSPPNGCM